MAIIDTLRRFPETSAMVISAIAVAILGVAFKENPVVGVGVLLGLASLAICLVEGSKPSSNS